MARAYELLQLNKKEEEKGGCPKALSDALVQGRKSKIFGGSDDGSGVALAIEADTSLSSKRMIRPLNRTIDVHGNPTSTRVDNGPDATPKEFERWATANEISIHYSQPGKPS